MHRILRQALQQAVDWQTLARNPADAVKPPKIDSKTVATLTPDQAAELLDKLKHSRVYWPCLIALATGLRRGEVLALRWRNIESCRSCKAWNRRKRVFVSRLQKMAAAEP
jgi:integrase